MTDLFAAFRDKAEALVASINSEGGVRATIETLRRKLAEADRRRAIRKLKSELQRIERQIGEMLKAVGVQAVALRRAGALASEELGPLCDRIIDLEAMLQEQKKELGRIEAKAAATRSQPSSTDASKCAKCGQPLPPVGEFCPHCGQPRQPASTEPSYCAHCGAALREGAKFCPRCGRETAL
jgi:membrane protease subunit (stomatin/prohibitin family)